MRFHGLDLNLLHVMDILLQEQSVSTAANKLGLSQAAVSNSLSRLRQYFNDEILVQTGRKMVPTPFAEQIIGSIRDSLSNIRSTITASAEFIPGESSRRFTIYASDYFTQSLLPRVLTRVAMDAPSVSLVIVDISLSPTEHFAQNDVDLMLVDSQYILPQHPSVVLFDDNFVCVSWKGNPAIATPISLEQYKDAGHVVVGVAEAHNAYWDSQLTEKHVKNRRIAAVVPSFVSVPICIVGTPFCGIMHERLATFYATILPLNISPLPFKIPPITEILQWHKSCDGDPGIAWLRGMIVEAANFTLAA